MELSGRFMATLTAEQLAILEEEEELQRKQDLDKLLTEVANEEKREEECRKALQAFMR